jgi:photosystem II stability/assembly factor-like uncharacterized protein
MRIHANMRRLLPSLLLLCALAPRAHAQPPGVWSSTAAKPAPGIDLYAAHFFDGRNGFVAGVSGASVGVLFRTSDAGVTWSPISLPAPPSGSINDIFFLPGTANGFLVGDDNYVAKTTNGGTSWTNISVPSSRWASLSDIEAVYFQSASRGWVVGHVAGGTGPRMAFTPDTGHTWIDVPMSGPANNLHDIDFFDDTYGLVVGTGDPTRKSATGNAGITWEPNANMGATLQSESVSMYGLDAIDGTAIAYAVGGKNYASPMYPVVRRTTDHGATWSNLLTTPTLTMQRPASDVIALGSSVLFITGQNGAILRSLDAGATWTAESVPGSVGTADLRKISLTVDNFLWTVGTSGNVLRTRLVPNATFAPASNIDFGTFCAESPAVTRVLTIGNDSLGVLQVTGSSIVQPAGGSVLFELVLPTPSRVWPRQTAAMAIVARVLPGAAAGTHVGQLRISTNDQNGAGSDVFRTIDLTVVVPTNGVGVDSAISRDAGSVRIGSRRTFTPAGVLRNTSTLCRAIIDTAYLARGTEFHLLVPLAHDTLDAGQRRSLALEFAPAFPCARYDTLIVEQSGFAKPLRVPISGNGVEPTYAASPADTLRFGALLVGTSGTATLELVNRKSGSCLDATGLRSLVIAGPNAAEFSTTVRFTPGSSFIPADSDVAIPFVATPGALGPRIAYAIITHELSAVADTVVLLARGVDAELAAVVDEVVFPVTDVGAIRDSTVSVALRNLGASAVTITGTSIGGADPSAFALLAPRAPHAVAGRASDSLTLRFQPSRAGAFDATLELRTDIGTTITVRLRGEAAFAEASIPVDPLDLRSVALGSCRDATIERLIVNSGRVPLRISALDVVANPRGAAGDAARFTIVAPTLPPDIVVAPGDSLAVTLRFCPDHVGEHVASLRLTTNVPGDALLDTLIGRGVDPRIVAADSIAFAPTRVGTVRDTTLDRFFRSPDGAPLAITSVSLVDGDVAEFALVAPVTPIVFGGDSTVAAMFRFQPTSRGTKRATVRFVSERGAIDVELSGTAIYPLLEIEGPAAPRARVGRTVSLRYWVANRGDDTGTIESVQIVPPSSTAFSLVASGAPARLAPGDSLPIDIAFAPPTLCEHTMALRYRGEGATSGALVADSTVTRIGLGVAPRLSARDSTVDFGMVRVGVARDSVLDGFLADRNLLDPSDACIDSVVIDTMEITGPDAASFSIVVPSDRRASLAAGDPLPLTIRFVPARTGAHEAVLTVRFDRAGDSVRVVHLIAVATPEPQLDVDVSFGADQQSRPGATVRVPVILGERASSAALDTLALRIAYGRTLLRLVGAAGSAGVSAALGAPALADADARTVLTLSSASGALAPGTAAELEFEVLRADVMVTDVHADSASAPGRPAIALASDSAAISIEDFCNASGRLVTVSGSLVVKASPNPVDDVVTIDYEIPTTSACRLAIYDAAGAAIATLVDGAVDPGRYSIVLDARDLCDGLYYCVLRSGRFESTAIIRVERHR